MVSAFSQVDIGEDALAMLFIPEPAFEDETWAKRGEQPLSWLRRSTIPRAAAARKFLNQNLAYLPEANQFQLLSALGTRWDSAFFELMVARTLQLLGATISIEPESKTGPRIDFAARFGEQMVNVEAISPMTGAPAGNLVTSRNPLLDIVEAHVPEGWGVGVISLPELGLSDSRKRFRHLVRQLPQKASTRQEAFDLIEDLPQGTLHLRVWPDPPGGVKVLHEAPVVVWDDTESRIRAALRTKKRQARAANGPTLVAIHAGGITGDFEDFDLALYGRRVMVLDATRSHVTSRFNPDGAFATKRVEAPVIDGVLAFVRVGFRIFSEPILYHHPRSVAILPEPLLRLERRSLAPGYDDVISRPSRTSGFLNDLGFVPDSL